MSAKGRYGLERSATEDALFTDAVMKDLANTAHSEFSAVARCYYDTLTRTLTVDTVFHGLDPTVIEVDIWTLRVRTGSAGAWSRLTRKELRSLISENGPPESWVSGTPINFFLFPGNTSGSAKQVGIYPPAATAWIGGGTLNLRYNAYVYPAVLTGLSDTPVLAPSEHYRIVPWICWQMAVLERSRGRNDAPVAEWYDIAFTDALELREIFRRTMEEPPRTANVGMSAGLDADDRRMNPMRRQPGVQVR